VQYNGMLLLSAGKIMVC